MNDMTVATTGTTQGVWDKKTFGAAVVTKTLDTLNGTTSSGPAPFDKQTFGAAVVSKTLDYMNADSKGTMGMNQDYDFQKSVLGAAYAGKGTIVDSLV